MPATKLIDRVKLSASQKASQYGGKTVLAMAETSDDVATFNRRFEHVATIHAILNQTGEGKGKRISGAKSHDFADQLSALQVIVKAGNVVTWIVAAPAA